MLILDVGCGTGNPPVRARIGAEDVVIGIDLSLPSLRNAKERYPQRQFLCARAESLPFSDCSFERVVSAVAMPYTNIALALAEIHRVLVPGGSLFMSLHPLRFTLDELRHALRYPKASLYRLYVLGNGVIFHASGRVIGLGGNVESFQTIRGIRLALKRAGFAGIEVSRPDGRLLVEAKTIQGGIAAIES